MAYLSVRQVSQRLGLSMRAVYERIEDGRLRAVDFGTPQRATYRISEEELDRYVAEAEARGERRPDDDPPGDQP